MVRVAKYGWVAGDYALREDQVVEVDGAAEADGGVDPTYSSLAIAYRLRTNQGRGKIVDSHLSGMVGTVLDCFACNAC